MEKGKRILILILLNITCYSLFSTEFRPYNCMEASGTCEETSIEQGSCCCSKKLPLITYQENEAHEIHWLLIILPEYTFKPRYESLVYTPLPSLMSYFEPLSSVRLLL